MTVTPKIAQTVVNQLRQRGYSIRRIASEAQLHVSTIRSIRIGRPCRPSTYAKLRTVLEKQFDDDLHNELEELRTIKPFWRVRDWYNKLKEQLTVPKWD